MEWIRFTSDFSFFFDYAEEVGAVDWNAHEAVSDGVFWRVDCFMEGLDLLPLGAG